MKDISQTRILIIDNDEGLVQAIATRLGSLGYRCITARTGAQGLAEFQSAPIDLVITDLNMPVLDGIGLVQRIRECSDVPVIIVTGFQQEYATRIRGLKHVTLFEKPFRSQALIDLVTVELAMQVTRRAG